MVNQQLLDYIQEQLTAKVSKETITAALFTQGWNQQDVNEGFSAINAANIFDTPSVYQQQNKVPLSTSSNKQKFIIFGSVVTVFLLLSIGVGYTYLIPVFKDASIDKEESVKLSELKSGVKTLNTEVVSSTSDDNKDENFDLFSKPEANTKTVSCFLEDTPLDKEENLKLLELKNKIRTLTTKIASPTQSDDLDIDEFFRISLQMKELQNQYNELSSSIAKRQITPASQELGTSVYYTYCISSVKISSEQTTSMVSTSTFQSLANKLTKSSFGNLACNLKNKTYTDSQIPTALHYMGSKLIQGGQFDDSFAFYKCAAEKYYDLPSMYRVAQIYRHGTVSFSESLPEIIVKTKIEPDQKQAYFWIMALFHAESAQKTGITDPTYQIGWNIIAMLDSLQQSKFLIHKDLVEIEQNAVLFVSKKYPEILEQ